MMALTTSAAKEGKFAKFRWSLIGVMVLGLVFLGALGYEYYHLMHEFELGLSSNIFASTFYILTGTHGIHVAVGLLWLICWFFYSFKKNLNLQGAAEDVECCHSTGTLELVCGIFTLIYLTNLFKHHV